MDYKIKSTPVEGFADANGIYHNEYGVWLGEMMYDMDGNKVVEPYVTEDGDFVPAPDNWRELIIEPLTN